MQIQVQLKDIIYSDAAIEALELNPYCISEGADGESWYIIDLKDAFNWGVINAPRVPLSAEW